MTTYYIDPTWTGTESGTEAEPFTTFAQADAVYIDGDTVLFQGGTTINEEVKNRRNNATYGSYGTGRATIAGDGVNASGWEQNGKTGTTVENLNITGGLNQAVFNVNGAHDFTIRNCTIFDAPKYGLVSQDSNNVVVEDVEVYGTVQQGMRLEGDPSGNFTGLEVRRCYVHDNAKNEGEDDNWDGCFVGAGMTGFIVEDCTFAYNGYLGVGANFDASDGNTGGDCIGTVRRCVSLGGWMGFTVSGGAPQVTNVTFESCIATGGLRGCFEMHGSLATMNVVNCLLGGTPVIDYRPATSPALVKWGDATAGTTGHTLNMTNCILDPTNYIYAFNTVLAPTVGTFANNCFYDNAQTIFYQRDGDDKDAAGFIAEFSATNSVTTEPQVNPDYTLAVTSPCLGTGAVSVLPLTDYSGRSFGNPTNMGVYALPQLVNNLLATNTGNTAASQNYDGVWTTADWTAIPDNTRYYPMAEGQGDTFLAYDGNDARVETADATITNYDVANWVDFPRGVRIANGTAAPDGFVDGLPYGDNGSLAVDDASAIDHYHQGLPFTANGRVATSVGGAVNRVEDGAMPLSSTGRLAVSTEPAAYWVGGVPFDVNSRVSVRNDGGTPTPITEGSFSDGFSTGFDV
jgi:hypothetical protein